MGGARFILVLFLPVISFPVAVDAGVVVNELYYDHPGADAGYEFVELMNTGTTPLALDGVVLEFHNGSGVGWTAVWRAPNGIVLAPEALFVLGGDAVVPAPDVVFALALQNGPDAIRLLDAGGAVLDVVGYGGLDDPPYVETLGAAIVDAGQSIARTPDGRDTGDNSLDFAAAEPTPGRRNVARDDVTPILAGETPPRAGRNRPGVERLFVEINNLGLADVPAGVVAVSVRDSSASGGVDGEVVHNVSTIAPGARERITVTVSLVGLGYHFISVTARYPADERPANDRVALVRRVGRPAILVSEVMSAPRDGCPQFVELYNAGAEPVDLTGYALRDTRAKPARIDSDSLVVGARAFVVVCDDAALFRACARVDALDVAGTWPSFNKSGTAFADSVVVTDAFGIAVDAVAYPGVKSGTSGRSLERVDLFAAETPRAAVWRLARDEGGSPGRASVGALEVLPRAACDASPNPFFPRDGDLLRVAIAPASGVASVVVRVYDPSGRAVRDVGTASAFPAVLLWDGRGRDGEVVRAGVYVLACEVFGADGARVVVEKVVVGCANRSP